MHQRHDLSGTTSPGLALGAYLTVVHFLCSSVLFPWPLDFSLQSCVELFQSFLKWAACAIDISEKGCLKEAIRISLLSQEERKWKSGQEWGGGRKRREFSQQEVSSTIVLYLSIPRTMWSLGTWYLLNTQRFFVGFCYSFTSHKKILPFHFNEKEHSPILLIDPFQKERIKSHDTLWFFLAQSGAYSHLPLAQSVSRFECPLIPAV